MIALTPSLILKAAAIGVGGLVAYDVGKYVIGTKAHDAGGVPKGSVTGKLMGHRHTAGAIFSQLHHPSRVVALARAGSEALRREGAFFEAGSMANGASDAFRHTYWGALMTTHLTATGMSVDGAMQVAKRVGDAHEDDSRLTGAAYTHSRHMDEHNNAVGAAIGRELLERGDTSQPLGDAIQGRVLAAIRDGETLVIDQSGTAPRASTADDLARLTGAAKRLVALPAR